MESASYLSEMMIQVVLGMNTCYPAKVLSFDVNNQTATIQPLLKTKEKEQPYKTQSIIEDVPVLTMRYQERTEGGSWGATLEHRAIYKKDDVVMCAVSQRSLDHADGRVPYEPSKAKIMNMRDSVILGVLIPA